jgi:hypothetical protein
MIIKLGIIKSVFSKTISVSDCTLQICMVYDQCVNYAD